MAGLYISIFYDTGHSVWHMVVTYNTHTNAQKQIQIHLHISLDIAVIVNIVVALFVVVVVFVTIVVVQKHICNANPIMTCKIIKIYFLHLVYFCCCCCCCCFWFLIQFSLRVFSLVMQVIILFLLRFSVYFFFILFKVSST